MIDEIKNSLLVLQNTIQSSIPIYLTLIGILVVVLVLNLITHYRFSILGVIPRNPLGIPGILFAPFIHANLNHLFFNLIPLIVLTTFLLAYGLDFYWNITWILIIYSGLLTWLFARPGIHIGASGLITAYWGFLVVEAYFNHSIFSFVAAFVCIYYFFGIFFGILPSQDRVSWEGHLFGLVAGITTFLAGYYIPVIGVMLFQKPYLIPLI
jgi:membrane associated rhomboid family serine protease